MSFSRNLFDIRLEHVYVTISELVMQFKGRRLRSGIWLFTIVHCVLGCSTVPSSEGPISGTYDAGKIERSGAARKTISLKTNGLQCEVSTFKYSCECVKASINSTQRSSHSSGNDSTLTVDINLANEPDFVGLLALEIDGYNQNGQNTLKYIVYVEVVNCAVSERPNMQTSNSFTKGMP